jgi:hypothetical protein
MKTEYRITWQREGLNKKSKIFQTEEGSKRFYALLTSNEPWKVFGYEGTELSCCSGYECGCEGATIRDSFDTKRDGMPKLLSIKLNSRRVGEWQ